VIEGSVRPIGSLETLCSFPRGSLSQNKRGGGFGKFGSSVQT